MRDICLAVVAASGSGEIFEREEAAADVQNTATASGGGDKSGGAPSSSDNGAPTLSSHRKESSKSLEEQLGLAGRDDRMSTAALRNTCGHRLAYRKASLTSLEMPHLQRHEHSGRGHEPSGRGQRQGPSADRDSDRPPPFEKAALEELEGSEDLDLTKLPWALTHPLARFLCKIEDAVREQSESDRQHGARPGHT